MTLVRLERLLTHAKAFGLATASPLQRAICRIADGLPLAELASCAEVAAAVGDVSALPSTRPLEMAILSGIRTGKSLFAAALGVRAALTCDVSALGPGEVPRVSILSLTTDLGRVVFDHLVGNVMAKPMLRALVIGEPTSDTVTLRHPSGRAVEVRVVAGARAGGSLVGRWMAGVVFDEAPRMLGEEDGVVNLDDARRAVLGRMLPGAQVISIGSPWAPRGPVYELVQEHAGKPSARLVIVRAPAHHMNPVTWTPAVVERLRQQDEQAYRTDVLAEFADPESSLFSSGEIERATRAQPLVLGREPRHDYIAALDPGTRGNAWTLVVATTKLGANGRPRRVIALVKQWQGSKADPLSPDAVLKDTAAILAKYGLTHAWSDQWAFDALRDVASRHGLGLSLEQITAARKVEMFERLRTKLADGEVELPPDPQLRADLLSVRKRVTMNGIAIELPRTADGRHADYAPAVAIVVARHVSLPEPELREPRPGTAAWMEREEQRLVEQVDRENASEWWELGRDVA